jgi:PfaD family protein
LDCRPASIFPDSSTVLITKSSSEIRALTTAIAIRDRERSDLLEIALNKISQPFELAQDRDDLSFRISTNGINVGSDRHPEALKVPAYRLENLGDATFRADHGLRFAYVAGAMANGIGSTEVVEAMARSGMLGFFGAAGLQLPAIEAAIDRLTRNIGDLPYGFNLIHSPNEPDLEAAVVDLYLRRNIQLVEASAYLDLTLPLVRFRVHGIHRDADGRVIAPNRVIAKVSRVEVASKFMAPPPATFLRVLLDRGEISSEQADLAGGIPMAQDVTAEADSGGHTDNRPSITLIPTMMALRDRMQAQHDYAEPLRVGAAGGIATPASAAAAFAMGAAYVLTGSVNQACVEAGTSEAARLMLAQTEQADTMMAPAADMFEMGVKVQVLKRGTMFPMRATKLYELYRTCNSLKDLPAAERATLEKTIFRASLEEIWRQTKEFFGERDPRQIERAERDPKHQMALVFRWYLGQSSRWAKSGEPSRKIDYQIWCGPAMAAFNEWVKGSFLESAQNRRVVAVAMNILYNAAVLLRSQSLRYQGLQLPANLPRLIPLEMEKLKSRLE